jgi:GNAT superfamily N-acetyltransferase
LRDLIALEAYRGRGLGKWLVEADVTHPGLGHVKRILLATRGAHELYRRYGGFASLQMPERWIERTGATSF